MSFGVLVLPMGGGCLKVGYACVDPSKMHQLTIEPMSVEAPASK